MDIHRYSGPMMMLWCCCDLNKVSFSFSSSNVCGNIVVDGRDSRLSSLCKWNRSGGRLISFLHVPCMLAVAVTVCWGWRWLNRIHTHWMTHRNTREKMSRADDERRCLMSSVNHEIESTEIWDSTGKSRRCQKILESVELITGFFLFLFYYHCGIYAIYVSISLTQHFLFRIRHFLALHTHQL